MRFKSIKLFPVVILVIGLGILLQGCGKQGSRFDNKNPAIAITSYEGYDPLNPYTDSTAVTLFQQRIYWHATDPDGVITGYAYRILDEYDNPISTAGNDYIDSLNLVTPQNVLNQFGGGWVLHYKPGAQQNLPLDDPHANRTIWTSNKYATVNFLASTVTGLPDTTLSKFEVICVDNRGAVCERIAFRKFKSYSGVPTCFLSTTKGNPDGGQVGTGIRLSFTLSDSDPFIQATPWYYLFKIQKIHPTTGAVILPEQETDWISTLGTPKINEYLLTKRTTPAISSDYDSLGIRVSVTKVIARVVDLAGIVSDTTSIRFSVKEGFHPKTIIHYKRVYALGSNHYIDYSDTTTPEVLPFTIINNTAVFATPFFRDTEGYYTAVNSSNLKSWIRWGWHGEYGIALSTGGFTVTDDPYDKKIDLLLDEDTNRNYYSEITHFDIRLNGDYYHYPPLDNPSNIVMDSDTGKEWLRVPVNSSLGQTIVLTNLPANTPDNPYHFFEVRAVDLQDVYDPTPAEFKFKVVNPVEKAQKSGILILDDDVQNANFAPQDSINARYANMLSAYNGEKVTLNRETITYTDIRNRKFALSDIQRFKLIIYHTDYPTSTSNLPLEQDAFALYLNQGGNMLISGGGNISGAAQGIQLAGQRTLEKYFGITYNVDATSSGSNSLATKAWFVKAKSKIPEYNDIPLAFDINPANLLPEDFVYDGQTIITDPNESSFVALLNGINGRKGLGPVTLFNLYDTSANSGVTPIYEYVSKPVFTQATNAYCPPTVTDFNSVNGKIVGLRKVTTKNSCYILGFPLSYMTKAGSKNYVTKVLQELLMVN